MKLDLSYHGDIPDRYLVLYNSIAFEVRRSFTAFIESVSESHIGNLDWFLCGPASRNIFTSPLFTYCCGLAFLQSLIDQHVSVDEIVTDSPALRKIIRNWLKSRNLSIPVRLKGSIFCRLKEPCTILYRLFGYLYVHLWTFIQARRTLSLQKPLPEKPLTIIDTFVMQGFIEKERYYTGMLDYLKDDEKETFYFVPTFYRIGPAKINKVLKRLRTCKKNILLKEDWLRVSDYFFAFGYAGRVRKLKIRRAVFNGCDLAGLIQEEIRSYRWLGNTMIGFLNFRFAQRLKEAGVSLRLVINWFENQIVDKGWNAGFNLHFPETPTVGYQGFITTPYYLCALPTVNEKKSGLLPQKISVIGKGLIKAKQEFCPGLSVNVAPALRYSHLFAQNEAEILSKKSKTFTVLVALPFSLYEAKNILEMIRTSSSKLPEDVNLLIKKHPTTALEQIQDIDCFDKKRMEFVEGPFDEILKTSDLLISSISSVCLEALAKGIPVAAIGNQKGLTLNPIPKTIHSDIWSLCNCAEDLLGSIQFYYVRDQETVLRHRREGERIRDDFFAPVTEKAVRNFLMLG